MRVGMKVGGNVDVVGITDGRFIDNLVGIRVTTGTFIVGFERVHVVRLVRAFKKLD